VKLVVFGLTINSSWGNGHATLWRGLSSALARLGHSVTFFERDLPYYAPHRDLFEVPGGRLCLYRDWEEALPQARGAVAGCDVAMVARTEDTLRRAADDIAVADLASVDDLPDASGATVMGTLLASQACTARRNQVHLCPDDLGSPCPWDAHSPVCAIPPRRYACGALLCVRVWHPSSSVPPAFVLR